MRTLRAPVLLALLVLLLTAGYCKQSALPARSRPARSRPAGGRSTRMDGRGFLEVIAERARSSRDAGPEAPALAGFTAKRPEFTLDSKGGNQVNKSHHIIEVFPRDLRQKEKFLKHLTGPLYFNPKCRKHFYRLYHNTRDCTIPAFYKRCARLLTRLAGSSRCTER